MPRPARHFKACFGCTKRTVTCKFDGSCDKYEKEKAAYDAERLAEKEAKDKSRLLADYEASNVKRARMYKGKKMGSDI